MVFFMGLNVDVKMRISFSELSTACSSDMPTTDSGGWLRITRQQHTERG